MTIKHLLLSFFLFFFISACTKISETEIGTGLIPPVDGVITKDTEIVVYTKNTTNVDTARISLYDDHALGYVNDPLFGTTTAAVNLQLLPDFFPFSFEVSSDSLILDSAVLALDVRGAWGDTTQNLSLRVKELDTDIPFISDSAYLIYNSTSVLTTADDITYPGSGSIDPRTVNDLTDTFHANYAGYQDSGVDMLRIRLSDAFGNKLLHDFTAGQFDTSVTTFKNALRGLQVSAEPTGNCLLRIGLANTSTGAAEPNTKLALYYRYTSRTAANGEDTTVKYFTINTSISSSTSDVGSAHSNYIKRDLGSSEAASHFPASATASDDYLYLQTTPGTFGTVRIDSAAISHLPNWIIHRAEIVMEQAPSASSSMLDNFAGPYLFMVVKNNNGIAFQSDTMKYIIPGFDSTNISTYDALFTASTPSYVLGNYSSSGGIPFTKSNESGVSISYYNFDVSRYVQGIVTKKNPQYTFTLYTPYKESMLLTKTGTTYARVSSTPLNNAGIGRVRLYGGGTDTTNPHRMKLHIVYSLPH